MLCSTMRLILTVVVLVLVIPHNPFISCNESSEEDDIYKNMKACPGGYCVAPHLCKNGSINVLGGSIIEPRFNDEDEPMDLNIDDQGDPCEEFMLRCCPVHDGARSDSSKPPDQVDYEDIELPPPTCGINRPNGYIYHVKKIGIAQFAEFPWMAVLLQRRMLLEKETLHYFCGGSLINAQVILTAAHCVKNYVNAVDTLVVRLGEWDTVTENEPLKHEEIGVRKIIMHENYVDQIYHNDIAMLIMEKKASLSVHINPICLPKADDNFDEQRCMVSGWGRDHFNAKNGQFSEVLKKIELPVIARRQCKRMFRATSLGPLFQLHQSFMCAGGEPDVDMCKGDGGSPLACKRDDAFVQAGIVAWGIGCGGADVPGAYVNVAKFVGWIAEKMQHEGIVN